jgi:tetratricopeptide (TPR) repeat protein
MVLLFIKNCFVKALAMKLSRYLLIGLIFLSALSVFAQSETEKGVELYRNGDFDGAISVLENVVKTDQKDRQAWLYLGLSFGKKRKDKDALKAFRKWESISEKPKDDKIKSEPSDGLKILSKPRSIYTDLARKNQTEGRVKLIVEFLENGNIGLVFPLQTLPDGLTENCIYAARHITMLRDTLNFSRPKKKGNPFQ